ncbi:acylphosphatase-2 isoform X1 [Engystomops pustulosus]|uniref:acylphosphatase-2 isoform X1 n=1 Tax=Engystomops pustulosus TaxID=76066 RepID=UPI003AFB027C
MSDCEAASMRPAYALVLAFTCMTMSGLVKASNSLKSVDYEVFGRVQGVCFRMYTEDEARKLGVVGWVKNTRQGTVQGQVQGPEEKVDSITRAACPDLLPVSDHEPAFRFCTSPWLQPRTSRTCGTRPLQVHPALQKALAKTGFHLDSSPRCRLTSPSAVVQWVH